MKTILAIDPGSEQSAWLLYTEDGFKFGKLPNDEVLTIVENVTDNGHNVVCEMVACYGMPVGKEVFETVRWIGRFEQATKDRLRDFHVLYRKDVTMHLCNSTKAGDSNVRHVLIDRFGGKEKGIGGKKRPGPLYGIHKDVWSALAIAVTFVETRKDSQ
jgi:hypothetical protein